MAEEKRVSEELVRKAECPEWTDTWHPVPHSQVLDSLHQAVDRNGLEVINRQYSMNDTGSRLFGSWGIASNGGNANRTWELGFRQATDKSMSIGICCGTTIIVCSNMCFNGEFVAFRKHTSGVDYNVLCDLAEEAVGIIIPQWRQMDRWFEIINQKSLTKGKHKALVYDMMTEGAFAPSKFNAYHQALDEERKQRSGRKNSFSLGLVQGAVTRMVREDSLFHISNTNTGLKKVIDMNLSADDHNYVMAA